METQTSFQQAARIAVERLIVNAVIVAALEKGYALSVDVDGEEMVTMTTDTAKVQEVVFDVDIAHLFIHQLDGNAIGWVLFVFGNEGPDVVSDYTMNLEPLGILTRAREIADKTDAGKFTIQVNDD